MKTILLSITLLFATNLLYAQKKITEGTISYVAEWDLPAEMKEMVGYFPSEIKVYFRGDSSSTRIQSTMYLSNSVLNARTNFEQLLIDIPFIGKKYSITMTPEDKKKMAEKLPKIELLRAGTETKMMAGYKVYKYTGLEKISNRRFDAWFTTDIEVPANSLTHFYDISYGFPVEFVSYANGISLKLTLKEIKTETVPPNSFVGGKDYEAITLDQLQKMSGGN